MLRRNVYQTSFLTSKKIQQDMNTEPASGVISTDMSGICLWICKFRALLDEHELGHEVQDPGQEKWGAREVRAVARGAGLYPSLHGSQARPQDSSRPQSVGRMGTVACCPPVLGEFLARVSTAAPPGCGAQVTLTGSVSQSPVEGLQTREGDRRARCYMPLSCLCRIHTHTGPLPLTGNVTRLVRSDSVSAVLCLACP